jgi:hypothetical protein
MDLDELCGRLADALRTLRDALGACENLARLAASGALRTRPPDREGVRDALLPEIERAQRRGR